jgi:hypothetical protein
MEGHRPRYTPEAIKVNQALDRPALQDCEAQECDSCSGRTRVAPRARALDRSNSRHDEAKPFGREHRKKKQTKPARTITNIRPRNAISNLAALSAGNVNWY